MKENEFKLGDPVFFLRPFSGLRNVFDEINFDQSGVIFAVELRA